MKEIIKRYFKKFLIPEQIQLYRKYREYHTNYFAVQIEYHFASLTKGIINKCEIRVFGMQRSGNHPIINWIGSQYPGKRVCYLNNVDPKGNPFSTSAHFFRSQSIIFNNFLIDTDKEKMGRLRRKDCIIYSYEDRFFNEFNHENFEERYKKYVGKSLKKYDILILRDPFNLFASRLKRELGGMNNRINIRSDSGIIIKLWKEHAKEYLGETNHLKNNKIVINYNNWCSDKNYRRNLSSKLGIPFTDKGFNIVSPIGKGSSFNTKNYYGKKDKEDLLKRWTVFRHNKLYGNFFKDRELIQLSNKIFGEIPGTYIF